MRIIYKKIIIFIFVFKKINKYLKNDKEYIIFNNIWYKYCNINIKKTQKFFYNINKLLIKQRKIKYYKKMQPFISMNYENIIK